MLGRKYELESIIIKPISDVTGYDTSSRGNPMLGTRDPYKHLYCHGVRNNIKSVKNGGGDRGAAKNNEKLPLPENSGVLEAVNIDFYLGCISTEDTKYY